MVEDFCGFLRHPKAFGVFWKSSRAADTFLRSQKSDSLLTHELVDLDFGRETAHKSSIYAFWYMKHRSVVQKTIAKDAADFIHMVKLPATTVVV